MSCSSTRATNALSTPIAIANRAMGTTRAEVVKSPRSSATRTAARGELAATRATLIERRTIRRFCSLPLVRLAIEGPLGGVAQPLDELGAARLHALRRPLREHYLVHRREQLGEKLGILFDESAFGDTTTKDVCLRFVDLLPDAHLPLAFGGRREHPGVSELQVHRQERRVLDEVTDVRFDQPLGPRTRPSGRGSDL